MSEGMFKTLTSDIKMYDLARPLFVGMPQSPNHPQFWHTYPRRHGDMVRSDGGSAANDLISMGTHVGTHIDAIAHVSQNGKLYDNVNAQDAIKSGKYAEHGVHTIPPMINRAVLIDVAGYKGLNHLPGGYEITTEDIIGTALAQKIEIRSNDIVLIRSGWGNKFDEGEPFVGKETGVPGIGVAAADYLINKNIKAAGADTIAFECLSPQTGHGLLPVHRKFLVENAIYVIETMDLNVIAKENVYEFTLILIPLNIFGATGSPVRPIAVVKS